MGADLDKFTDILQKPDSLLVETFAQFVIEYNCLRWTNEIATIIFGNVFFRFYTDMLSRNIN